MALTSRPVLSGVGSGPLLLGSGGDEAMHFANYIVLGLLIAFILGPAPGGFLAAQIIIATISLRLAELNPSAGRHRFLGDLRLRPYAPIEPLPSSFVLQKIR